MKDPPLKVHFQVIQHQKHLEKLFTNLILFLYPSHDFRSPDSVSIEFNLWKRLKTLIEVWKPSWGDGEGKIRRENEKEDEIIVVCIKECLP